MKLTSKSQEIKSESLGSNQYSDIQRLRPKTAALLLGISIATLWRLIARGEIRAKKTTSRTTSISMADLRAYIDSKEEA